MKTRFYRPELDALRFFAFLCVFCHHAERPGKWLGSLHAMGAFGMPLFFVLSAYLIVLLLIREQEATGTVDLKAFAIRRVLRIWPLYFLVLFFGYGLGLMIPTPTAHLSFHALVAFSLLAGNIYVLHHGWAVGVITPLWSLSVEEQFYLGIPFLARAGGRRMLSGLCYLTLLAAYLELTYLALQHATPTHRVWANSLVEFQFFAVGGLIALWSLERKVKLNSMARAALFVAGLLLWYEAIHFCHLDGSEPVSVTSMLQGYAMILSGTVSVFFAFLDTSIRFSRSLLYLGKISYGLYVFHDMMLWMVFHGTPYWAANLHGRLQSALGSCIAMVATIALAMLSYRFFESPMLRFKSRFERVQTRAV